MPRAFSSQHTSRPWLPGLIGDSSQAVRGGSALPKATSLPRLRRLGGPCVFLGRTIAVKTQQCALHGTKIRRSFFELGAIDSRTLIHAGILNCCRRRDSE